MRPLAASACFTAALFSKVYQASENADIFSRFFLDPFKWSPLCGRSLMLDMFCLQPSNSGTTALNRPCARWMSLRYMAPFPVWHSNGNLMLCAGISDMWMTTETKTISWQACISHPTRGCTQCTVYYTIHWNSSSLVPHNHGDPKPFWGDTLALFRLPILPNFISN